MTAPRPLLARIDWTAAACRGDDSSNWVSDVVTDRARGICHGCPIVTPCLAYAVAANEEHGLWGGLDRMERKQYRRELMNRLGPDDPVVQWLRTRTRGARTVLCPRCLTYDMQTNAPMCLVCTERHQESKLASKRLWWNANLGEGATPDAPQPVAAVEPFDCIECGHTFDRTIPEKGRPAELCSDQCRRRREKRREAERAGRKGRGGAGRNVR